MVFLIAEVDAEIRFELLTYFFVFNLIDMGR